ncbi:MAG: J domain-containing protein [Spirochaetota bacterium]
MDIFDRLGNLIRAIIDDEEAGSSSGASFRDPDEAAAWEELERYMKSEAGDAGFAGGATGPDPFARSAGSSMPDSLRRDFRNLEVPVGAPMEDVRKAYKRLVTSYHPDRHSSDPDKLRTATEITKKLNQSYQRIRLYYEGDARQTARDER